MSDDLAARLLAAQRKRAVATILGHAERAAWWGKLPAADQRQLRDTVLSALGVMYDFCRDVVSVGNEDTIRNEHALRLLEQIHDSQRRVERAVHG